MQEFLLNNKVSWNLMSLTGYRTLVIFYALLESPKNLDEINTCLFENKYINEKFSSDTLRLYLNSLRKIGCEISRANKSNNNKYTLISHPFEYDIPQSHLKAFTKLYKSFQDKLEISELIQIESLLNKIMSYVKTDKTKEVIKGLSVFKRVNMEVLNDLTAQCKKKNQITILYNSPKNGKENIEIIADKLVLKSGKIYLTGENVLLKDYSFFPLERVLKIVDIKMFKKTEVLEKTIIKYENFSNLDDYELEQNEKVLEVKANSFVVQCLVDNEFFTMQKILQMGNRCKLIDSDEFRNKLVSKLKNMEKMYEEN